MKTRSMSSKYYQELFDSCKLIPKWKNDLDNAVSVITREDNEYRYMKVESETGVPWVFTGLIHWMECNCHSKKQIHNGQNYKYVTTIHPVGRGSWNSWEESAIEALYIKNLTGLPKEWWTLPKILESLERWNGTGYRNNNVNSPYLWSGSNHGLGVGKYTSDGNYSPTAVSKQLGAAVILKELIRLNIYVPLGTEVIKPDPRIVAIDKVIGEFQEIREKILNEG